ncbi:MAG: NAD-dependent epimerase/dehydratase family protein [Candidatus Thorarchaeota archaeon]|nr:MAG: hypothetical protein DRO87_11935 [Candidatus Thorarchaeota archaeon]RLI55554.1 MAG: hypothetical protein DRP09_09585 [Candidatus Thorarchaeota archaeon]
MTVALSVACTILVVANDTNPFISRGRHIRHHQYLRMTAMTRSALVTGAAGFIASHLVDHLLHKGYSVMGIDNLRTGKMENLKEATAHSDFRFVEIDVTNRNLVDSIEQRFDVIFHLAAISSVKLSVENPRLVHDNNTTGTLNILELARERDVERVVLSSSAAVYGDPQSMPVDEETPLDPLSPYAASKVGAEMYCRAFEAAYGIGSVILRYFNVYGPRQEDSAYSGVISIFVNRALKDQPMYIEGDGLQTRSFVHVDDVVRATELAGTLESVAGQTINVSALNSVSIGELASRVLELTPDTKSTIVYTDPRVGDVRDSIGSMDRARDFLGFVPEVSLDEGLKQTITWYASRT